MSDFGGAVFVRGYELIQALDIASGTVVEVGDLVKLSGGAVEACGATTDNLVFIGVAKEAHGASDGAGKISVALRNALAIYRIPLDAAASIGIGDNLQMYTSAPSKKLTASNTDAVASAVEKTSSSAYIHVVFSLPAKTSGPRYVGDAS
jgi:hypothetical protein